MTDEINQNRRRFLATAAMTIAASQFGNIDFANAQSNQPKKTTSNSFEALKQIDAGDLNVAYAESGSANGRAVILLHGWPYDIHSFVDGY